MPIGQRKEKKDLNRRSFIGLTSSVALAGLQKAEGMLPAQVAADKRPNFLFIIADDLMYRTINSINNPEAHTPNLDQLVKRGYHFTHCFHQGGWTGAICIPSRTMLNTGLS
jgi:choline-sulfatase